MKKSNNLEIINTKFILNKNQLAYYRDQLTQFLKEAGIISICLDNKSVFIEYMEGISNTAIIRGLLQEINFPMNKLLSKSKNEIIYS
jgi:hypothetical protein